MITILTTHDENQTVIEAIRCILDDTSTTQLFLTHDPSDTNLLLNNEDTTHSTMPSYINSLNIEGYKSLISHQRELADKGFKIIKDYSDPEAYSQNRKVHFYNSDNIRPFMEYVSHEVESYLKPYLPGTAQLAQIGSMEFKAFPLKLDLDLLLCISDQTDYHMTIKTLLDHGFEEPRSELDRNKRVFLYTEMVGLPIDLHVMHCDLASSFLYNQHLLLSNDKLLREKYKQFKLSCEAAPIGKYRHEKQMFNKKYLGAIE